MLFDSLWITYFDEVLIYTVSISDMSDKQLPANSHSNDTNKMFWHYVHSLYLSSPQFFQDLVNICSVNEYICQLDEAHRQSVYCDGYLSVGTYAYGKI